ncbi:7-carboxy-7-deazaguanine synthase QueE [Microbacterium fluvii]|uniref:7-carboxy-7-deazaguanine synthase n=1 Tax=Microbacterium fluvii TaxID=415215 RepID=A0ABW2HEU2_9MICO
MGQAAVFLRLANCNLNCSWCDTRHSWDWASFDPADEQHEIEASELMAQLIAELQDVRLLIVTGGEPLLQQPAVSELVVLLRQRMPDLRVEIETNGTVSPTSRVSDVIDLFVVSPKLSNSGIVEKRRVRPSALASFPADRSVLKFVVTGTGDLAEVAEIRAIANVPPERTWIMPEGTTPDLITQGLRALSGPALQLGYSLSSRLHIQLWADARGR